MSDLGLLALRVGLGGTVAAHGAQKLFGAFGGGGIAATATFMESVGFRPGWLHARVAGMSEVGGGALLVLGLATPAAASAVAGTMAVAATSQAGNGFFNANGGLEYPSTIALAAASLALTGPGRFSIDQLSDHRLKHRWLGPLGLTAAAALTWAMVSQRRLPAAANQN
jgi:putative oxidoreductase